MSRKKLTSSLMLTLTALIWGIAFVAQSVGMDYIGPYTFNTLRFVIGGAVLIPCIMMLKKKYGGVQGLQGTPERQRKMAVAGGLCCGLCLAAASNLQQLGILYSDSVGKVGFITTLYIVLVPILGSFFGRKPGTSVWISVGIALVGMYMLCITEDFSIERGDVLVFISALVYSVHIMVIDYFSLKADGVVVSCIQMFVASACSAFFMLFLEQPNMTGILAAWIPLLYAGVLSCGVAYTLQVVAQKNIEPAIASLLMSLESVFSLLAGWVILHERLSYKELFGCLLMFAAIILAQLPSKKALAP